MTGKMREALEQALDDMQDGHSVCEYTKNLMREALSASEGGRATTDKQEAYYCTWCSPNEHRCQIPACVSARNAVLSSASPPQESVGVGGERPPGFYDAVDALDHIRHAQYAAERAREKLIAALSASTPPPVREEKNQYHEGHLTPTEFVTDILSACDASNWDAELNTGDYFKGLRDAYENIQGIAMEYQTSMYAWTKRAANPPPPKLTEEEIARTIYEVECDRRCFPWDKQFSSEQEIYRMQARAVLALLRTGEQT